MISHVNFEKDIIFQFEIKNLKKQIWKMNIINIIECSINKNFYFLYKYGN